MKDLPLSFGAPDAQGRTASLPPELSLLVLDNLASPGTFVLVHFVVQALKGPSKRPVVLVGAADGEPAWDGLLRKQGVQLAAEKAQGSAFVDGDAFADHLGGLFKAIEGAVARCQEPLIVVDSLVSLLWSGHALASVEALATSLFRLVRRARASLVVLAHADLTPSSRSSTAVEAEDVSLVRALIRSSDVILRLRSLGPDAGEMAISRGPGYLDDPELPVTRGGAATQYRLTDSGADYVLKGLDRGFI